VAALSSSTNGANTPNLSFDGNTGTRWESAQGVDPQWIYWDLGSAKALSSIVIDWEVASASNYVIQGSTDAATWTTLATVVNSSDVDQNHITNGISGTYRYVRMYGTTRTTVYGYSIWEVYIYGSAVSSSSSSSSSSAGYYTIASALSSSTNGANTPNLSFDGNTGTRWESAQGVDPQWIYWDLGSNKSLSQIVIDWEVASASNYVIQGSTDAATWTTLATVVNSSDVDQNHITNGISGTYRYVKMNGTTRTTQWGYSIWEVYIK
jgi:hypothetical protein